MGVGFGVALGVECSDSWLLGLLSVLGTVVVGFLTTGSGASEGSGAAVESSSIGVGVAVGVAVGSRTVGAFPMALCEKLAKVPALTAMAAPAVPSTPTTDRAMMIGVFMSSTLGIVRQRTHP